MRHCARAVFFALAILSLPSEGRADAQLHEWLGTYQMNHDGFPGTLMIVDSRSGCAVPPWCALVMRYVDSKGIRHAARIDRVDDRWQHIAFTIEFPGNPQRFDAYLFSWDKTKMAGTTVWGGRTFGFYATRDQGARAPVPLPATTMSPAAERRRILAGGVVEIRLADGTIIRRSAGSREIIRPDGTTSRAVEVDVVTSAPPTPPPGSDLYTWLDTHGERLLNFIRTLVGNDPPTMSNYLQAEGPGGSPYEKIDKRTRTIGYLLAP